MRLSRIGKQVIALRSGHHVPLDEPDLVIAAIREILSRAAQPVVEASDTQRGVQLVRRAQDAMGGAAGLTAIRDTTHVMEIALEWDSFVVSDARPTFVNH